MSFVAFVSCLILLIAVHRSNYRKVISVLVGEAAESFIVHQDLICASSEFFRAAVSQGRTEAEAKKVHLHEQNPAAFNIYLDWLYDGERDVVEMNDLALNYAEELVAAEERIPERILPSKLSGPALCKLWVLGDFLDDLEFKKDVVGWIHNGAHNRNLGFAAAALELIRTSNADLSLHELIENPFRAAMITSWFSMYQDKIPANWLAAWLWTYVEEAGDSIRAEFRASYGEKYLEQ